MKITKARLEEIILEEIINIENEELLSESIYRLIDLQAKQMGVTLTEQEKESLAKRLRRAARRNAFGLGVGAATALAGSGMAAMQADYNKGVADAMAANQAAAEQMISSVEYQADQIKKQLGNQFAFTWTVSENPTDQTPFPAVVADDGQWQEVSIAGALKKGKSPVAVLPPEWSVLKQVLTDLESGSGPRVTPENISAPSTPASGRQAAADSNRIDFFESDVWNTAKLKSFGAARPYKGAVYIDYESLPDDYVLPLTGKTPGELYVKYWDKYTNP